MATRYVWWDEVAKREVVRTECRLPKTLHEFLVATAKRADVSLNALLVGIVADAAQRTPPLHVEVHPAVRVSANRTDHPPVQLPEPSPGRDIARGSRRRKV